MRFLNLLYVILKRYSIQTKLVVEHNLIAHHFEHTVAKDTSSPMEMTGQQQARRRRAILFLLSSSLLLNAAFLAHHFLWRPSPRLLGEEGGSCGLSWALQAAKEAEAVAAVACSGHGQVLLDGVAGEDGRPGCECNACFAGPDCSLRKLDCTADADR